MTCQSSGQQLDVRSNGSIQPVWNWVRFRKERKWIIKNILIISIQQTLNELNLRCYLVFAGKSSDMLTQLKS